MSKLKWNKDVFDYKGKELLNSDEKTWKCCPTDIVQMKCIADFNDYSVEKFILFCLFLDSAMWVEKELARDESI